MEEERLERSKLIIYIFQGPHDVDEAALRKGVEGQDASEVSFSFCQANEDQAIITSLLLQIDANDS